MIPKKDILRPDWRKLRPRTRWSWIRDQKHLVLFCMLLAISCIDALSLQRRKWMSIQALRRSWVFCFSCVFFVIDCFWYRHLYIIIKEQHYNGHFFSTFYGNYPYILLFSFILHGFSFRLSRHSNAN